MKAETLLLIHTGKTMVTTEFELFINISVTVDVNTVMNFEDICHNAIQNRKFTYNAANIDIPIRLLVHNIK